MERRKGRFSRSKMGRTAADTIGKRSKSRSSKRARAKSVRRGAASGGPLRRVSLHSLHSRYAADGDASLSGSPLPAGDVPMRKASHVSMRSDRPSKRATRRSKTRPAVNGPPSKTSSAWRVDVWGGGASVTL